MLSGKAVSRAVRAHILAVDALNTLLFEEIYPVTPSQTEKDDGCELQIKDEPSDIKYMITNHLKVLYEDVLSQKIAVESLLDDVTLKKAEVTYYELKSSLKPYRTAKLWLQYMDMVDLLKTFIKAERTGNWNLHLETMKTCCLTLLQLVTTCI
jgi:hypothetical protein